MIFWFCLGASFAETSLSITEHAMGTSMKKRQTKKQNPTEIKANKNTPADHAKDTLN